MKIAVLGKGGSGKSSISWLLANYISSLKNELYLIDGDHNMDLKTIFFPESDFNFYLKEINPQIRKIINLAPDEAWRDYILSKTPIKFSITDQIFTKYIQRKEGINLMTLGLGDELNLKQNFCSHAYASGLKYLLPTLEMKEGQWLILDSVAGSDMVTYGLYFGIDINICVVNDAQNSIKVANQIQYLFNLQGIKLHFIINKHQSIGANSTLLNDFKERNIEFILGEIKFCDGVLNYQFQDILPDTKSSCSRIFNQIQKIEYPDHQSQITKLQSFEMGRVPN